MEKGDAVDHPFGRLYFQSVRMMPPDGHVMLSNRPDGTGGGVYTTVSKALVGWVKAQRADEKKHYAV